MMTTKGVSPMKRAVTIALSCTVAVLLPASVAVAGNGNGGKSLVSKACVAEKNGLKKELGNKAGKEAFRAIYGKHAMRNCKKGTAEEVEDAKVNASQECRAERADESLGGEAAFMEKYGTNAPKGEKSKGAKRNAFGKCVSATAKQADEEEEDAGVPTPTG